MQKVKRNLFKGQSPTFVRPQANGELKKQWRKNYNCKTYWLRCWNYEIRQKHFGPCWFWSLCCWHFDSLHTLQNLEKLAKYFLIMIYLIYKNKVLKRKINFGKLMKNLPGWIRVSCFCGIGARTPSSSYSSSTTLGAKKSVKNGI